MHILLRLSPSPSRPFTGAWIETVETPTRFLPKTSPLHGGVDRNVDHGQQVHQLWRSPLHGGVDGVDTTSRGEYVDAQHLAFVEKFFGDSYREFQGGTLQRSYPSQQRTGDAVEASFSQIVTVLQTAFLSQVTASHIANGGSIADAIASPYFAFRLLDFANATGTGLTAYNDNRVMWQKRRAA